MRRTDKKGFTIVELVIVIAVIAILAAVLIPNLSRMVKNAKESSDIQLIRNMNTAMQVESVGGTKHYDTAHDAITAAAAAGYDLTKISLSDKENTILWDEENQCFAYLRKGETTPEYVPNSKKDNANTPAEKLWKVYDVVPDDGFKYSVYWNGGDTETINVENLGFDAGTATIGTVNYTGNAGKTVVIRTNSYSTSLTIDAASDSVKHYDLLGVLTIENVKGESYHEFGKVKDVTIKNGRFVAEEGSEIEKIAHEEGAVVDTSKCAIWGEPTYTWSADKTICTATRIDTNGMKTAETETVTAVYSVVLEPTYETEGQGKYTATFTNPAFGERSESVTIAKLEFSQVDVNYANALNASLENVNARSATEALEIATNIGLNAEAFSIQTANAYFAWNRNDGKVYLVKFNDKTDVDTTIRAILTPAGEIKTEFDTSDFIYVVTGSDFCVNKNMTGIYFNKVDAITREKTECLKDILKTVEIGNNVKQIVTTIIYDSEGYVVLYSGKKSYITSGGTVYYVKLVDGEHKYVSKTGNVLSKVVTDNVLYDANNGCFANFASLEKVYIGKSVELIGYGAFVNCKKMNYLYYNTEALSNIQSSQNVPPFRYAGENSPENVGFVVEIGKDVTSVPALFCGGSTSGFQYVTEVKFEAGSRCTTIQADAFTNCRRLRKIELPESIVRFEGVKGDQPFAYCYALEIVIWHGNSTITTEQGSKTYSTAEELAEYLNGTGLWGSSSNKQVTLTVTRV